LDKDWKLGRVVDWTGLESLCITLYLLDIEGVLAGISATS
jgi:hypothetical protein